MEEVAMTPEGVAPLEPTAEVIVSPTSLNELKSKMKIKGKVTRIELYGAFLDLGIGVEAIIHISQLGNKRVNRVADVLKVGQEVEVWVDNVDIDRGQVTVTMAEPLAVDWSDLSEGQVHSGRITRLETFGAFVDIGAEKEGLVHISEMSHNYIKHPSEVLQAGADVQVKVLGFNKRKRRINLSIKALLQKPVDESVATPADYEAFEEEEADSAVPTAMEIAMRRAMGESREDSTRGSVRDRRRKKGRRRRQQDELLARTLNMAGEN